VAGARPGGAPAVVTTTRAAFENVVLGRQPLAAAIAGGTVTVAGDATAVTTLFDVLDRFDAGFAIVEPRRPR
jgi:alkyl sulfatase BDS1-like metallo-beta-lactamase superfamily hydrolase